jgi:hypothetical protein
MRPPLKIAARGPAPQAETIDEAELLRLEARK